MDCKGAGSTKAYPVAPLARNARGTRDACLSLRSERRHEERAASGAVTDVSRTLPLTQECQGNLVLPSTRKHYGQRRKKKQETWSHGHSDRIYRITNFYQKLAVKKKDSSVYLESGLFLFQMKK